MELITESYDRARPSALRYVHTRSVQEPCSAVGIPVSLTLDRCRDDLHKTVSKPRMYFEFGGLATKPLA